MNVWNAGVSGRGIGRAALAALAAMTAIAATPAFAGPPFLSDDPETTDLHHWEIFSFATGVRDPGASSLDLGEDINYGFAKDVQLTMVLPLHRETGQPLDAGDVELAAKWRFARVDQGSPLDIGFFPRVFLPTGRGAARVQLLLPLWFERDFGKWSLFGGGGYELNPGAGSRNFAQGGIALARLVRPGFQLGGEIYAQTSSRTGERPVTGVNFGSIVHIKGPFSWLASLGQGLNRRQTAFYTALKLDL